MTLPCPRCDGVLHEKPMDGATVLVCDDCTGALVAQSDLVPVLTALAPPTMLVMDPDEPLEPMPDPGVHLPCPHCQREMEPFAYMDEPGVIADRCPTDQVIWADAGELGVMSVIYARTNKRLMARFRKDKQEREEAARIARLQGSSRERANQVATAMLTGPGHWGAGYGNPWKFLELLFGSGGEGS